MRHSTWVGMTGKEGTLILQQSTEPAMEARASGPARTACGRPLAHTAGRRPVPGRGGQRAGPGAQSTAQWNMKPGHRRRAEADGGFRARRGALDPASEQAEGGEPCAQEAGGEQPRSGQPGPRHCLPPSLSTPSVRSVPEPRGRRVAVDRSRGSSAESDGENAGEPGCVSTQQSPVMARAWSLCEEA